MLYHLVTAYCYLLLFSYSSFADGNIINGVMLRDSSISKSTIHKQAKKQKIIVEFFFRQGCKECGKVKEIVLPRIKKHFLIVAN